MKKIAMVAFLSAVSSVVGAAPADTKQAYIDSSFASMDTNGDGRVDKAEYAHFQQARFSKQAQAIDDAFKAMDTNKDGRISKAEAAVVAEIEKYFDGLDTDKDGFLSLAEMQQAMVAAQTADTPR